MQLEAGPVGVSEIVGRVDARRCVGTTGDLRSPAPFSGRKSARGLQALFMSLIVLLDGGPLGMITNPKSSSENEACKNWLASLEVRRELGIGLDRVDGRLARAGIEPPPAFSALRPDCVK